MSCSMAGILPFVHRLRVRYHECDRQGIVFNAQWFAYFDITLTELWREAFGSYDALIAEGSDVVVVDAQASFLAPARFDEEIDLSYAIERLGTTSMTVAAGARRDGTPLVEGRMVYVFVDPKTLAKREIAPEVRERLAPWVTA
jgi:acyl-CoA thioester hydrolase